MLSRGTICWMMIVVLSVQVMSQVNTSEETFVLERLDSLSDNIFNNNFTFIDTAATTATEDTNQLFPAFNDSIILSNMLAMTSEIPLAYNERVERYIEVYSLEHRDKVQKMLGLSKLYFPIFEEHLDKEGLPHMLKYMPVIESALNANAVSRAGATGLWQIMYSTGRMLGLTINSYVDERRDPYRSTAAAIKYLKQLYGVYNDWALVIAAYNCGPGNLNKAIARAGGERNFWKIMHFLPRETRGYVPAFFGAMYVMEHSKDYELYPIPTRFSFNALDTVIVNRKLSLPYLSEKLSVEHDELVFLNPALNKRIIPPTKDGYALILPLNKVAQFEANRDSILNEIPDPEKALLAQSKISSKLNNSPSKYYSNANNEKITYTVKSGDNLGFIAEWYDCTAQQLRMWNGMYGSTIKVGQKICVYVPKSDYHNYSDINNLSFQEKQEIEQSGRKPVGANHDKNCNCVYYKVKPGDTLWDISKKYRIAIDEIKKENNIGNSKRLKPGMVLRISLT